MISRIEFSKLSGSGNDFVCIDNCDGRFDELMDCPDRLAHFARAVCHRGTGVGADGIVFASQPEIEGVADVAARFLEADGTETALCGNGTACFIRWVSHQGIIGGGEAKILTPAGVVRGEVLDDRYIRVCIPVPEDIHTDVTIDVDGSPVTFDYAVTGVEHAVVYVDDIRQADVAHLGPALRYHPSFAQPKGVNANFVQVLGDGELAIRTYEYGVEAETLACGTGSAAAAILAARRFDWSSEFLSGLQPVRVHAPSGDTLRVYFKTDDGGIIDPCLETIVRCAYTGVLSDDLAAAAQALPPESPGDKCFGPA